MQEPHAEKAKDDIVETIMRELSTWPEDIRPFISPDFISQILEDCSSVPEVIDSLLREAKFNLGHYTATQVREAELQSARELGPVANRIHEIRSAHRALVDKALKDLIQERDKKITELTRALKREYKQKMDDVITHRPPDELDELNAKEKEIKEKFYSLHQQILSKRDDTQKVIEVISREKNNWNSPERKAKRESVDLSYLDDPEPTK